MIELCDQEGGLIGYLLIPRKVLTCQGLSIHEVLCQDLASELP